MQLSDTQREWLTLAMAPGVGTTHFIRLLAKFGNAGEVLRASEAALAEVVGPKLASRVRAYRETADIAAQEQRLADYDAQLLTMDEPLYPARLAEIYDPPLILCCRGEWREAEEPCVAIVGTRKATAYGLRTAEMLGGELARRGVTVVSGLAAGIDAAAHQGALDAGGRTIAVLGCGVDVVYPKENAALMHRMIQEACVLSPFVMGTKPSRGLFPYRNRIISGMSMGVVVVEAPPRSGALITARVAAEQGREVFAVPGRIGEWNSRGPHALLREGAKLVESVDDILVELELPAAVRRSETPAATSPAANTAASTPATAAVQVQSTQAPQRPAATTPAVSSVEKDILSVLQREGSFVDEIALACRLSVSEALSALTMLELKGMVRQFSGKRFAPQ